MMFFTSYMVSRGINLSLTQDSPGQGFLLLVLPVFIKGAHLHCLHHVLLAYLASCLYSFGDASSRCHIIKVCYGTCNAEYAVICSGGQIQLLERAFHNAHAVIVKGAEQTYVVGVHLCVAPESIVLASCGAEAFP